MIGVRRALPKDAPAMVSLLNAIIDQGGTTTYSEAFTEPKMMDLYVSLNDNNNKFGISCMLAYIVETGQVVGFQGLEWSDPSWPGGEDKLDADWAIIATFVDIQHAGNGIGRTLFEATLQAAKERKVSKIDATIRLYNTGGQAYYEKMGFVNYKSSDKTISKRFDILP